MLVQFRSQPTSGVYQLCSRTRRYLNEHNEGSTVVDWQTPCSMHDVPVFLQNSQISVKVRQESFEDCVTFDTTYVKEPKHLFGFHMQLRSLKA